MSIIPYHSTHFFHPAFLLALLFTHRIDRSRAVRAESIQRKLAAKLGPCASQWSIAQQVGSTSNQLPSTTGTPVTDRGYDQLCFQFFLRPTMLMRTSSLVRRAVMCIKWQEPVCIDQPCSKHHQIVKHGGCGVARLDPCGAYHSINSISKYFFYFFPDFVCITQRSLGKDQKGTSQWLKSQLSHPVAVIPSQETGVILAIVNERELSLIEYL